MIKMHNPQSEKLFIQFQEWLSDLESFISLHKRLFIYGTGNMGRACFEYLKRNHVMIDGFITTAGGSDVEGINVYSAKDFKSMQKEEDGILLAVNEGVQDEVCYLNGFEKEAFRFEDRFFYGFQFLAYDVLNDRSVNNEENKIEPSSVKKILIIQLELTFGDLIWSTAFFRELKRECPDAIVSLVFNEKHYSLIKSCPHIDIFYPYENADITGFINQEMIERTSTFSMKYLSDEYDAVFLPRLMPVNERDAVENLLLMSYVKAKNIIGHTIYIENMVKRKSHMMDSCYTHLIRHKIVQHESENKLGMLKAFSGYEERSEDVNSKMQLWLDNLSYGFAKKILSKIEGKKIVIAPVGSVKSRSWDSTHYANVLNKLIDKNENIKFIILGGSDAIESADIIEKTISDKCINMVNKTDLIQAAAIISMCDLYVGPDTGLMHMASSFNIPIVMLAHVFDDAPPYIGCAPERTGPHMVKNVVLRPPKGLDECKHLCKRTSSHCINQIKEEDVLLAIEKVLKLI